MDEIDYVVITAGSFDLLIEVVCEDDDQLLEILSLVRVHPERDHDRDLRVPEAPQADLQLGDQMTTSRDDNDAAAQAAALQASAKRHMWLHFTRMSTFADADIPMIVRGSGQYVYDQHGKRYLDGLSGLFVSQIGHGRTEVAEARRAAGRRARLLPALVVRAPAGDRAGRAAGRPGPRRPEPGLLHHQRLGGRRVGLEAGQAVLQGDRPAGPVQGDQPRHRLPRHVDGRPGHHRAGPGSRSRSSRCPPAGSGCRTPTSTARRSSSPTT